MPRTRARRVALTFAAAVTLLWMSALVDRRGPPAQAAIVQLAPSSTDAPPGTDVRPAVVRVFEATLDFVQEVARSFDRRDYMGAVVRLLVIVEVLLGGIGVVICMSVWDAHRARLVYRIVDVMGALFLVIALLLFAKTLV
jgi:hypothetical protein